MIETAPDGTADLELTPLPMAALSPAIQKVLASPPASRVMAAKGIAPLRPAELVTIVYQLSFAAEPEVKQEAESAPASLPDAILVGPLADPLPPAVLHFFASRLPPSRIDLLEKVLLNRAVADQTFVFLAGRLHERELELIFQNDTRLLRCPAIVQAAYFNKQARMSSLNRAIELLARNHVRVDGIPAFDEIVKSIQEDAAATQPVVDQNFRAVVEAIEAEGDIEAAARRARGESEPSTAAIPVRGEEKAETPRKGAVIDFSRLKLYEKIRLATLGNAYCRQNLIRDPNRMVAMAAIRSPLITDNEVVMAACNRALSEDVIRYVAHQKEYVKMYQVRKNLVQNPKCPLPLSLKFLGTLGSEDIKTIARSKNIPSALATAARKLVQTRGIGG